MHDVPYFFTQKLRPIHFILLVLLVVFIASITNNFNMNKSYLKKLGKNIKKYRIEKGLTQDDLGINGISRSMVSLIEIAKSDITATKLKIIADNMGIKVKDLFDFE